MPYKKRGAPSRLNLPSDPDYWVVMKARPSFGDKSAAQSAMVDITQVADEKTVPKAKRKKLVVDKATGAGVLTEVETQAYFSTLLSRLIIEWNLTDERDKVLPITVEAIDELEPEDGDFLVKEAQERLKGRPVTEEGPFEKPSLLPSQPGAASR